MFSPGPIGLPVWRYCVDYQAILKYVSSYPLPLLKSLCELSAELLMFDPLMADPLMADTWVVD